MNLGLLYRILSGLLFIFFISTSLVTYIVIKESQAFIETSRLEQAHTLAASLAEGSLDALVVKDYELLERWLVAATPGDDFAYAYLSRPDGVVISHTDLINVSRQLQAWGMVSEPLSKDHVYHSRPVREVIHGAYLAKQHLANVHLAYYLDANNQLSDLIFNRTIALQAAALAFLSLAAFVTLRWGLMPIRTLVDIIQRVTKEQDYSLRMVKHSKDEVGKLVDAFNHMLDMIQVRDRALQEEKENALKSADEVKLYAGELEISNQELSREIKDRMRVESELKELSDTLEMKVKQRTSELEELNKKISIVSRNAGMSEVACGVLHNVGNVLNSVNVSTAIIRDGINESKLKNLNRVVEMLTEHREDVGHYLTQDEKGVEIPHFLELLADKLGHEQQVIMDELHSLDHNINHIKNAINMQQSYAGSYGVMEMVDLAEVIDDCLKINMQGIDQCHVDIRKEFSEVSTVFVDKHKVMQVLINLISNAIHAMVDNHSENKRLTIRLLAKAELVLIEVEDTGVGIDKEDLPHLFEYGFKRRKGGHGFGLHNSALVASDLEGKIEVRSDGKGRGACFSFSLPLTQ